MFSIKSLIGLAFAAVLAGCASVKYSPIVTEYKSIPDLPVVVSYLRDGIYQVQVNNNLLDVASLQWNSSAYLNTAGDTVRLIHLQDVEHFPDAIPPEQAPSNMARGARMKTYFVGESWFDFARRGVTPRPRDTENKAKIYLAFEIKGKRVYWTGEVAFLPVKK